MNKTKIKNTLKRYFTVFLYIFIVGITAHVYHEGIETWEELTEWQTLEDDYFKSKSNEVTSIEPERSSQEGGSKGKTVSLSDQVAPEAVVAAASPTSNKKLIEEKGRAIFGDKEVNALMELVDRESDFNHKAQNPVSTAYGMFQFLDSTWEAYGCEKTSDPVKQTECGLKYIQKRYETPSKALAYHDVNNSY